MPDRRQAIEAWSRTVLVVVVTLCLCAVAIGLAWRTIT